MEPRYRDKEEAVRRRWERLAPTLDERARRLFVANEALEFGYGGRDAVERVTGIAKNTIRRGIAELNDLEHRSPPPGRQRQPGAGRKTVEEKDPGACPSAAEARGAGNAWGSGIATALDLEECAEAG